MSEIKVTLAMHVGGGGDGRGNPGVGSRYFFIETTMPSAPTEDLRWTINKDWGSRSPFAVYYNLASQGYEVDFRETVPQGMAFEEWRAENLEPEWKEPVNLS